MLNNNGYGSLIFFYHRLTFGLSKKFSITFFCQDKRLKKKFSIIFIKKSKKNFSDTKNEKKTRIFFKEKFRGHKNYTKNSCITEQIIFLIKKKKQLCIAFNKLLYNFCTFVGRSKKFNFFNEYFQSDLKNIITKRTSFTVIGTSRT